MTLIGDFLPFMPKKPSILDRIGARLFPTGDLQGLLSPEAQQGVQRQGLAQLGANLLSQSGASTNAPHLGQAVGNAMRGVDLNALTQHALQVQELQQRKATQRAVTETVARHPAQPGETTAQTYQRIAGIVSELAGIPGTEDLVGKLSNVLAQLKPDKATEDAGTVRAGLVDPKTGKPVLTGGVPALLRFFKDGRVEPYGVGAMTPPNAAMPSESERRSGSLYKVGLNAWNTLEHSFAAPGVKDYLLGKVPMGLGQAGMSTQYQSMMRAGADFGRSYLYIVSGAAVGDREALEWAKANLPQIGDDPKLIEEKWQALRVKSEAMRLSAGRAGGGTASPVSAQASGEFDEFLGQ